MQPVKPMRAPASHSLILAGFLFPAVTHGVVLMQLETFDSSTGWGVGNPHPSPPSIQADVGPDGNGDFALRMSASAGQGAGSRLAIINTSDWAGDYLTAGIDTLTMDLRNQSFLSSDMRVAVNGPGGWFVTDSQSLSAFSTWTPVSFDLSPGALVSAGGSDASSTLSDVGEIRILHSSTPSFRGGTGQRTVLVDNIQAVPEPKTLMLTTFAALALLRRKRTVARGGRF